MKETAAPRKEGPVWLCSCELPQGHRGGTHNSETSGNTARVATPDPQGGLDPEMCRIF